MKLDFVKNKDAPCWDVYTKVNGEINLVNLNIGERDHQYEEKLFTIMKIVFIWRWNVFVISHCAYIIAWKFLPSTKHQEIFIKNNCFLELDASYINIE